MSNLTLKVVKLVNWMRNSPHVVAIVMSIFVFTLAWTPKRANAQASFSIDVDAFLSSAATMFNGIFPIFAPIIGISLGIGLASMISKRFESIV